MSRHSFIRSQIISEPRAQPLIFFITIIFLSTYIDRIPGHSERRIAQNSAVAEEEFNPARSCARGK